MSTLSERFGVTLLTQPAIVALRAFAAQYPEEVELEQSTRTACWCSNSYMFFIEAHDTKNDYWFTGKIQRYEGQKFIAVHKTEKCNFLEDCVEALILAFKEMQ